jgi:uncharacterized protein (DUF885 family)
MTEISKALSRRLLLTMLAGVSASVALPGRANAKTATPKSFTGLLARFAEEILALSPETATSLGLDTGARAALKYKLSDASEIGAAKWAAQVKSMQTRLSAIDRKALNAADQVRYDTVAYAAQQGIDGTKFAFGGAASGFFGGTAPYPVTQQDGAITSVAEFLDSLHQINSKADAESYLARLSGMAKQLDQESAQIMRDAGNGVMPPNFIAKNASSQLQGFRNTPAATQTLVTSIAQRTAKLGLKGNWALRATKIVESAIYPALDRQIAAYAKATANATDIAGVYKLPDGEAYYQWALRLGTTTNLSPQEIHALGIEQNKAIQSRMDMLLKAQGMSQGSVGERLLSLTKDPRFLYPDTDAGRAELIAYCNEKVTATRALMPKLSNMKLKADLIIKRVAPDIQDGASLGYMNFASLDGTRPAIYYINLKSTSLWPKYQLTTLTAHEGVPGHTWQGAYLAERAKELPLIASLTGFNAFIEGWALYSEQLCDEFGLYADDPFGQLGYLQAQQFRACRLVVDTGIHALIVIACRRVRRAVIKSGTTKYCGCAKKRKWHWARNLIWRRLMTRLWLQAACRLPCSAQ